MAEDPMQSAVDCPISLMFTNYQITKETVLILEKHGLTNRMALRRLTLDVIENHLKYQMPLGQLVLFLDLVKELQAGMPVQETVPAMQSPPPTEVVPEGGVPEGDGAVTPPSVGEGSHHHVQRTAHSPDSQGHPVPTPLLSSVRFRLAIVCWLGFAALYAQRTNLSIAMVCMVRHKPSNETVKAAENPKCPELTHSDNADGFEWSKDLQGQILGSFFYGYLVLQIAGGVVSERIGAKHVVTAGMLPVAVLTLLTPVLTKVHYVILIILRVLVGVGQGVLYPAAAALWSKWAPPMERTLLVGFSLSGGQFGNAFALPVGGLLCSGVGWESIFYLIGGIGLFFVIVWMMWVKATPAQFKGLTKAERIYLERTIPHVAKKSPSLREIPWGRFFTSLPFWALIIAHSTGNYTYYMNLTQIPTYMKEVLKFNIKSNGAFSMLPYLVFWICTVVAGILSDFLLHRNVKMVVVRKTFAVIGLVGPAVFMIVTGMVSCEHKYVAVMTLCCAVGLTGFGFASYMVNHGDLAPDYAGTLFGITNTVATLPGFVAPVLVGALTPNGSASEWRLAFLVAGLLNVGGAVVFVLFASCEIQPWSSAYAEMMERKARGETVRRMSNIAAH